MAVEVRQRSRVGSYMHLSDVVEVFWVFAILCMTVSVEMFTTYECYASDHPYICRAHFAHLTASIEGTWLGLAFLNKDGLGKTRTMLIIGVALAIPIVTIAGLAFSLFSTLWAA